MPRKKNQAPQPIGRGKAGSGKRMIHREGGGKKLLKTWRSLSKGTRKSIKSNVRAGNYTITGYLRSTRDYRRGKRANPTTGRRRAPTLHQGRSTMKRRSGR